MVDETKREAKRSGLRAKLLEAAARRIAGAGLPSLRARDVTADVGSSLGGLYNAFEDLDDLVMHVNSATLAQLGAAAAEAVAAAGSPQAALKALARTYLGFARENHALWAAVFAHRLAADRPLPDWYREEQSVLLRLVAGPLRGLAPELDEPALLTRARTLFAAIHGVVSVSLESRFVGVPEADLGREVDAFVDILVNGLKG